ncbi:DUF3024 domain-containing protein [Acidocella sp.]|uniref:DUF3024 domain-containing protein n=1 Tax=Acidocella sp. TaxID=50710 RepID=UPI003D058965
MTPHPNELDKRRIERALERRARYRYVSPRVVGVESGYKVESPCCSRNIDTQGGIIDIALLAYHARERLWGLYRKNHEADEWLLVDALETLPEALNILAEDTDRRFWQ